MDSYAGTHKRKVKVYATLSKIFFPVGLVLLILGVVLLPISIVWMVNTVLALDASGQCVHTATSIRCNDAEWTLVFPILFLVFAAPSFVIGLPMFILSFVFRNKARANRALAENNGVDYSDFPYGK